MENSMNHVNDENRLARIVEAFARWSFRWIPDSMVFALSLTVIIFLLAWGMTNHGPVQLINDWTKGFWALLTFAMQMCLIMIGGFAFADSKPIKNCLSKLLDIPKTKAQTIIVLTMILSVLWYFNWAVGMMMGIVLGREVAVKKRGLGIHYPLLAGIGFGTIVMGNGPSLPAQLWIATPGHLWDKMIGVIPLSQTSFDIKLIITNIILFITLPILFVLMSPPKEHAVEIDDDMAAAFSPPQEKPIEKKNLAPAERWDRSFLLPLLVAGGGFVWIGKLFVEKGVGGLDLNNINFILYMLALLLHGSAKNFMESVQRGSATVYGIIIQFPLYAGIFGIISYSGFAQVIANAFIAISTPHTYAWIIYLYSGILDFFVPSAGSKFVIEAPYILPAAKQLGADVALTVNAYSYGSLNYNLVQPFFALPILGAFKLKFHDILPYTLAVCLWTFIVVSIYLLVLPMFF